MLHTHLRSCRWRFSDGDANSRRPQPQGRRWSADRLLRSRITASLFPRWAFRTKAAFATSQVLPRSAMNTERGAPGSAAPIGRPVPCSVERPQVKIVLTGGHRHATWRKTYPRSFTRVGRESVGERFEVANRLRGCRGTSLGPGGSAWTRKWWENKSGGTSEIARDLLPISSLWMALLDWPVDWQLSELCNNAKGDSLADKWGICCKVLGIIIVWRCVKRYWQRKNSDEVWERLKSNLEGFVSSYAGIYSTAAVVREIKEIVDKVMLSGDRA